jgi:hypothetical protein
MELVLSHFVPVLNTSVNISGIICIDTPRSSNFDLSLSRFIYGEYLWH